MGRLFHVQDFTKPEAKIQSNFFKQKKKEAKQEASLNVMCMLSDMHVSLWIEM